MKIELLKGREANKYFAPDVEHLYHYTSIEALINGIVVKNPNDGEELCLRATHNKYMNDPKEFEVGVDMLKNISLGLENYGVDVKKILDILEGYKDNFYFACFSEDGDSLPMWNMYANNGHGVALKFERFEQECNNEWIVQCEYGTKNTISNFREFLEKDIDVAISYLVLFPFIQKDLAYSHEKETRFVGSLKDVETHYRYSDGMAIPYKNVFIDKSLLKSIVIGPAVNQEEVANSLRKFLDDNNLQHVEIEFSEIPYRS